MTLFMRKLGEEESEAEINVVERVIQISIIGDVAVGKTSLVNCFLDRKFELEVEPTRGIDMVETFLARGLRS